MLFNQFTKLYSLFKYSFQQSLQQCLPEFCLKNSLRLIKGKTTVLIINNEEFQLKNDKIHVIAAGKASISMVKGIEDIFGNKVIGGIVSCPYGSDLSNISNSKIKYYPGAKDNLPDEAAMKTVEIIEDYIKNSINSEDLLLFLISGGGSALLPAPVNGITLEEKVKVTKLLSSNEATIQELNTVRIALSRIKGGKLAKLFKGNKIGLIVSDIIDDPIELIASGPTIPQNVSKSNALNIIKQKCWSDTPESVKNFLSTSDDSTTDTSPICESDDTINISNFIILNNKLLVKTIINNIQQNLSKFDIKNDEIKCKIISTNFIGDATNAGYQLFDQNTNNSTNSSNNWIINIYAGETTVNFPKMIPENAKGGRNQELSLAFFEKLIGYRIDTYNSSKNNFYGIACYGTDGQDGPTDATGAYCSDLDIQTLKIDELLQLKEEITTHLKSKTSYHFWNKFNNGNNHVKLGKTGHNLMDIYVVFYKN